MTPPADESPLAYPAPPPALVLWVRVPSEQIRRAEELVQDTRLCHLGTWSPTGQSTLPAARRAPLPHSRTVSRFPNITGPVVEATGRNGPPACACCPVPVKLPTVRVLLAWALSSSIFSLAQYGRPFSHWFVGALCILRKLDFTYSLCCTSSVLIRRLFVYTLTDFAPGSWSQEGQGRFGCSDTVSLRPGFRPPRTLPLGAHPSQILGLASDETLPAWGQERRTFAGAGRGRGGQGRDQAERLGCASGVRKKAPPPPPPRPPQAGQTPPATRKGQGFPWGKATSGQPPVGAGVVSGAQSPCILAVGMGQNPLLPVLEGKRPCPLLMSHSCHVSLWPSQGVLSQGVLPSHAALPTCPGHSPRPAPGGSPSQPLLLPLLTSAHPAECVQCCTGLRPDGGLVLHPSTQTLGRGGAGSGGGRGRQRRCPWWGPGQPWGQRGWG